MPCLVALLAPLGGHQVQLAVPPPSVPVHAVAQLQVPCEIHSCPCAAGLLTDHYIIEVFKHMYAVRLSLGDPEYTDLQEFIATIQDPAFAAELADIIKVFGLHLPLAPHNAQPSA